MWAAPLVESCANRRTEVAKIRIEAQSFMVREINRVPEGQQVITILMDPVDFPKALVYHQLRRFLCLLENAVKRCLL